ncbi:Hypothetical protein AJAP_28075 [Amycolatopsis japonica]|uniref:Uncharacterized protein n=1 Tax=Amycolatopsis japonica TaxID=208439 RepID=A0A075V1I0_9PSEU|nr:hypothetical protein [Amycolatopsis japonica]AIG78454.1 Hypothetical protein AJAP_28075 [Amycolatopsis japonica]
MARSRRVRKAIGSVDQLVAELPEPFLTPCLGEDPLRSLTTYVAELTQWVAGQGVRPEAVQRTTIEVMAAIGAAPSEWYRRSAAR